MILIETLKLDHDYVLIISGETCCTAEFVMEGSWSGNSNSTTLPRGNERWRGGAPFRKSQDTVPEIGCCGLAGNSNWGNSMPFSDQKILWVRTCIMLMQ
jgi:hypothetical protein